MTVIIRPATAHDVTTLQLCPEDQAECKLMHPELTPQQCLAMSHAASDAPMVAVDSATGEVLAMFGLALHPYQPQAAPWMLSSASVRRFPIAAIRTARGVIRFWRAIFPGYLLTNSISRHQHTARRFIVKLGAVIKPGAGDLDTFYFP